MQSQDGPAILLTGTPAALQTGTPAAAPPPGPRQRVAVLVGLPGCGKSRLAVELEGMGWVRVNQDTLGTRGACEAATAAALKAGASVVVDRCNFDARQRATWVGMAASAGVPALAVELLPPLDICEARAAARTEHPTVGPGAEALTVVRRMAADFVPVGIGEGFAGVLRAVSDADAAALAARLGQAGPAVPRPDLEGWQGLPAVPGGGRRRADDRESWRAALPVDGGARVAAWGGRGALPPPATAAWAAGSRGGAPGGNVVPFRPGRGVGRGAGRGRPPQPGSLPPHHIDATLGVDPRPIVLFDLNGTLTCHTFVRQSSGKTSIRPGLASLRPLALVARLGVFTSATQWTLADVLPALEAAAGSGPPLFACPDLLLHRGHTVLAGPDHVAAGGKRWDTIKPLGAWFARLDRVALVDDDAFKAAPGERGNLVHVPCWDEGDASCGVLSALAAALQEALGGVGVGGDVRGAVGGVEAALAPFWARARKKLAGAGGEGGEGGGTQPAAGGRGSANAEPALAA